MSLATPASQPLYFNVDVLASIAEHLPWPTLMHFLKFPNPAPTVVRPETKHRVLNRIRRFLVSVDADTFFDTLETSGAVVVGSFIREIILSGKEGAGAMLRNARSLDVLVERHREEGLRGLLEANGFSSTPVPVRSEYKDGVYMVEDYAHENDHAKVCSQSNRPNYSLNIALFTA
jgi:hypothetical protein